ncbi:hypothetical protein ISN75_14070 [Dyella marensis]|uniref:hypothetical protein n=1 Tax=Dyella marensis TaxID=500610 RepID=UPI0031D222F7
MSITKYRAHKRGIPFDLTVEDVVVPDFCPVLGLPLYRNTGGRAQGSNSPTVDRIDPDKGYITGNVRVISSRANAIKSDATPEELLRVAAYFQENR